MRTKKGVLSEVDPDADRERARDEEGDREDVQGRRRRAD
jgi:hypothetical protein